MIDNNQYTSLNIDIRSTGQKYLIFDILHRQI